MSHLGKSGLRSKRASTARIIAWLSESRAPQLELSLDCVIISGVII